MRRRGDVALATDEKSAITLTPFIDNLSVKPDIKKSGEYVIFYWVNVDWDCCSPAVLEFEEAMEKLDCYEFVYHGDYGESWKCGDNSPGLLFTNICYCDQSGHHVLGYDGFIHVNQSEK